MLEYEPVEIVNRFKSNYYFTLYKNMNSTTHDMSPCHNNGSCAGFSRHHSEGSIWAHTVGVVTNMISLYAPFFPSVEEFLAALLHDVGKVSTEGFKEKEDSSGNLYKKTTFHSHASRSTFLAYDVLKKIFTPEELNDINIYRLLTAINYHDIFVQFRDSSGKKTDLLTNEEIMKAVKIFAWDNETFKCFSSLVYADNAGRISTKEHTQNNHTNKQHLDYYLSPKSLNKSESVRFPEGRPLCIMMIGLPYSGKSYIREELLEEKKYAVISLDDELEKEAINRDSSYNDIFADSNFVKAKYGELNNKLAKAVYGKENIIIDMTNLSRKSRKKRLDILTNDYYRKALLVLETTDNIHSRMNTRKEKTIPLKVIDDMTLSFNMPTHNEFDDITLMMSD